MRLSPTRWQASTGIRSGRLLRAWLSRVRLRVVAGSRHDGGGTVGHDGVLVGGRARRLGPARHELRLPPVPTAYRRWAHYEHGETVRATNDAVAGATSSDVLDQLASDEQLIDHVRGAKVVEIEVGANDVAYSKSCGTALDCYTSRIPSVETNLNAIVDRTRELTSSQKALVVLLDYWSVWLGGRYAAAKGAAYVSTAEQLTDDVDAVIKSTAAASGSGYVDLRGAFKGPTYAFDETHYLSSDGDHPDAAGHQQIAAATEAVVEKALHL